MDKKSGKTLRKVKSSCPRNGVIFVHSDPPLEINGNKLVSNVPYSIKKGKRWEIIPKISNYILSEEKPDSIENKSIRCYITQSPSFRGSEKGLYLIDSDCKKELGTKKLFNRKLNGGSFNASSVIKNWEKDNVMSNKENFISEQNHNKEEIIEKVLDNRFTSEEAFVSTLNNNLLRKGTSSLNNTSEKDKMFINEIIPINNRYSTKSLVYHPTRWEISKRKDLHDDLNSAYEDYKNNNDNNDGSRSIDDSCDCGGVCDYGCDCGGCNGGFCDCGCSCYGCDSGCGCGCTCGGCGCSCGSCRYDDYDNSGQCDKTRKPFTFSENILSFSNDFPRSKKNRKQKKKKTTLSKDFMLKPKKENINHEVNKSCSNDTEKNLPFISMNLPLELFLTELKSILEFCRCWSSKTSQQMILVDLDYIANTNEKSFIILKPVGLNHKNEISLKVILNLWNYDYNKLSNNVFLKLSDLITFIQSTIDNVQEIKRPNNISNILKLTTPINNLFNTWNTEIMQTTNSLFCFNEEWEKYELQMNNIDFETISEYQFILLSCEICHENCMINNLVAMTTCQHLICEKCLSINLRDLIINNELCLNCPVANCQSKLNCVSILSVIPFQQYQIRVNKLESEIIKEKARICKSCDSCLIKSDVISTKQFDYLCKCGNFICGICGNQQHWPASCEGIEIHDKQLKQMNDIHIPLKTKSLTVRGKFCQNCNKFHRNSDKNFINCSCKSYFCYKCGEMNFGFTHRNCVLDKGQIQFKIYLEKHGFIPEPDSFRSKVYCDSVNVRLMLRPSNISLLKRKLFKIDSNLQESKYMKIDRENLFIQYKQILKIIESIYISKYQSKRDSQLNSEVLPKSAEHLMFFVRQFQSFIEQLDLIIIRKSETQISKSEMNKKREMVNIYIKDAMDLVAKFQIFIH